MLHTSMELKKKHCHTFSGNRSDDDDLTKTKKRVVREAFGSGSEGNLQALKNI